MFVVAGVTGHVGSVVATELLAHGAKVKVLVRSAEKGAAWAAKGAEVAVGALTDSAFLGAALTGASGFFVLLPADMAAPDFFAAQKAMAAAIASGVQASGVPHVAILSSIGADLPEGTGPIKGLYHLEQLLLKTGAKLTAIRAGYFQENIAQSLAPAKHMGIFPNFMPSEDIPMPMIATKDIGHVAAEALLKPPAKSEVIDLTGPAYTPRQQAEKLGAALGKTLQIVNIPEPGWIDAMMQGGLSRHHAEGYAEMYHGFGSGAIRPKGDRLVQGQTTLDEVVKSLV